MAYFVRIINAPEIAFPVLTSLSVQTKNTSRKDAVPRGDARNLLVEPDPFLQAFHDSRIKPPSVPGASTAEEEFLPLLPTASEIEHALMVQ
jgi:hypothetical protein